MANVVRVALDARCTRQMSVGMQRYARELEARLPAAAPDLEFLSLRQCANFGLAEQLGLPFELARRRPRLVHYLSLYAPVLQMVPAVVTMHDLIHLEFPAYFKRHIGPYYQLVVRRLLARAGRVITDDERTIDELRVRLGVPPHKIRVIPLGVDDRLLELPDAAAAESAARPYIVYAGNHRPHKNLATLCAAWAKLPDYVPYDLVCTGKDDFSAATLRERANGARLICTGDLTDEKLAEVMRGARALVYPSLSEGFGLPMLEALAVGTAVIASDAAVPGVLRNQCCVVPARDIAAWTAAIEELAGTADTRRAHRRAYARTYTWDHCARATAACYRELLEEL